jgi:DNA invertase Pin-like site-specific DNA recombinase
MAGAERRALIWARVSEDKGQDVEGQVRELSALAGRMGLAVWRVIRVGGESVYRGDPPQKAEVLELARRRYFDVLLVWSLDRWARRRRDGARDVFETFPAYHVTVCSLQESWLSTEQIPEFFREILGRLMLWLAEEESGRKSARVRLRYETNRNRATAGGGKARWGRGRIPTLEEAEAVRIARAEGLSVRQVAVRVGLPRSTVGRLIQRQASLTSGDVGAPPSSNPTHRP